MSEPSTILPDAWPRAPMPEEERLEVETIIRLNNSWGEGLKCVGLAVRPRTVWARFDSVEPAGGRATLTYQRANFEKLRARFRAGESVHWRDEDKL
jgi:hypothetical protein